MTISGNVSHEPLEGTVTIYFNSLWPKLSVSLHSPPFSALTVSPFAPQNWRNRFASMTTGVNWSEMTLNSKTKSDARISFTIMIIYLIIYILFLISWVIYNENVARQIQHVTKLMTCSLNVKMQCRCIQRYKVSSQHGPKSYLF